MWVQKCDICGEEKREMSRFRYKIKVEREVFSWEDCWWEKVDLCLDGAARTDAKGGAIMREEKTDEV